MLHRHRVYHKRAHSLSTIYVRVCVYRTRIVRGQQTGARRFVAKNGTSPAAVRYIVYVYTRAGIAQAPRVRYGRPVSGGGWGVEYRPPVRVPPILNLTENRRGGGRCRRAESVSGRATDVHLSPTVTGQAAAAATATRALSRSRAW